VLGTELIAYLTSSGFSVSPVPNFIPTDTPDNKLPALYVMGSGGWAPHEYVPTERPTFQVIIKGKVFKTNTTSIAATEAEAKRLIQFLHRKANFVVGTSAVISCLAMQSNPIYLGQDEQSRPMFSTNFTFYVKEAIQ